ncbi:MAG: hypothetical protein LUE89_07425 [Clostridiales bacterium]|nr:hypothetical protein [Clostridiales bacterium]
MELTNVFWFALGFALGLLAGWWLRKCFAKSPLSRYKLAVRFGGQGEYSCIILFCEGAEGDLKPSEALEAE